MQSYSLVWPSHFDWRIRWRSPNSKNQKHVTKLSWSTPIRLNKCLWLLQMAFDEGFFSHTHSLLLFHSVCTYIICLVCPIVHCIRNATAPLQIPVDDGRTNNNKKNENCYCSIYHYQIRNGFTCLAQLGVVDWSPNTFANVVCALFFCLWLVGQIVWLFGVCVHIQRRI